MKRWVTLVVVALSAAPTQSSKERSAMNAGFAKVDITPPLGTRMMGFGTRDMEHGCTAIHDEIFVRALYLQQGDEAALILGYDLCFLGQDEVTRFKAELERCLGLQPHQVLMNASHNHVGPSVGTWYRAPTDKAYIDQLETATLRAARAAHEAARPVIMMVGRGHTRLPVCRRKVVNGQAIFAPNPSGYTHNDLPVVLFTGAQGKPVCLLFSVSCHPSIISGWEISAEYPGAACKKLEAHLGAECALFLQGVGGDAKPCVIAEKDRFRPGTWEDVEEAGQIVASEVIDVLGRLKPAKPALACALTELEWPLEAPLTRNEYAAIAADVSQPAVRRAWAQDLVASLDAGRPLLPAARLMLQYVRLGKNVRLVALEGEPVAKWGPLICGAYHQGVTFALGYTNGQGLYLPTSDMLPEGGYEVVSFWEYGFPARLSAGFEKTLKRGVRHLQKAVESEEN
ncbi:MAG: hypothetical protein ACUVX8_09445 [Candidatus Zipacnadales bacterium]